MFLCVEPFAVKPRRLANLFHPFLFARKGCARRGMSDKRGAVGTLPQERRFGRRRAAFWLPPSRYRVPPPSKREAPRQGCLRGKKGCSLMPAISRLTSRLSLARPGTGAVCQWHTIKAPFSPAGSVGAIRMPPACRTPLREELPQSPSETAPSEREPQAFVAEPAASWNRTLSAAGYVKA